MFLCTKYTLSNHGLLPSPKIAGKLQKAQRLLKQSKQKDYYKVLGVSRDADTRTIRKALYVLLLFKLDCILTDPPLQPNGS